MFGPLLLGLAGVASYFLLFMSVDGPVRLALLIAGALGLIFLIAWTTSRSQGHLSGRCFAFMAGGGNLGAAYASVYQLDFTGFVVMFMGAFVFVPVTLGFGIRWSLQEERRSGPAVALVTTLVLSLAPVGTFIFPWPLHLAFMVSSPALEQLADETVENGPLDQPTWAGVFRVSSTCMENGNVALIVGRHTSGRNGLVRVAPGPPRESYYGPLYNHNWDFPLSERWRYQSED